MAKKSNLDSPISRVRNDSQTLKKDAKNVKGEDRVIKVSQNIKLESANVKFSERGEQHLYSSDSNKYLLKIHKNGKLVANFYDKGGKTYLHFGDEFFKSIDTNNKYADFRGQDVELNELVLDKKLDVQVKSTNGKDFSCLFSAFGAQIVDTKNGNSVFRNTDYPFDIAVSDRFLEKAMGNDNTCNLGEDMKFESATMQALLIASTQNARMRTNQEIKTNNILDNIKRVQPITKNYGALSITSLPVRVPKGEKVGTEWLNLAEKDGKLYGYFNLEVNGRKQVGKYYEVRGMTFENNNLSLKLHAGNMTCNLNMDLKGTGKTVQKFLDSKEKEYADRFKKFESKSAEAESEEEKLPDANIYSYADIAVVKRTEKGNELVEEKEPEVVEVDEHGFILVPREEKDFVLVPPHKVKGKTNEEHGLVVQENEHGLAVQEEKKTELVEEKEPKVVEKDEHSFILVPSEEKGFVLVPPHKVKGKTNEEHGLAVQNEKETGLANQSDEKNELRTPESIIVEDERYNSTTQAPNAIIENDTVFYQNSPEETTDLESQEPPLHEIQEDEHENSQLEPTNDNDLATRKRKENYDTETSLGGAYFAGGQIIDDYTVEYEDGRKQNVHVGKDGKPRTELEEDNQSGLVPREKEPPQNDFGDAENDREREPEPPREPVPPEPKPHEHDDDDDSGDNEPNHDEQDLTPPVPPHETPDPPHENPDPPHENPDPPHENPDPSPRQETPSGNGAPSAQQAPKGRGGSGGGSAGGGGGSAPKEVKEERIWASFLGVSALLTALSVFIPFLAPFAIAGFATSAILYTKPWNWGNTPLAKSMDARARRKELEKEDRQLERESKLERLESDKARYQQEIESIDQIVPQLEEELAVLQNGNGRVLTNEERLAKQQKITNIDAQIKNEQEEISNLRQEKIAQEEEYKKANTLSADINKEIKKSEARIENYRRQQDELTTLQKNVDSILNNPKLSEEEIAELKQETLKTIQEKYGKQFDDLFSEDKDKSNQALTNFVNQTNYEKQELQKYQANRAEIINMFKEDLVIAKETEAKAKEILDKKCAELDDKIAEHNSKISALKDEKAKIQSELAIDALSKDAVPEFNRAEAITNVEKQIDSLKKRKETLQKAVKISEQMEYGLRPEDIAKNSAFDDRWKNTGPTEKAMKQNRLESERHEYKAQEETKKIVNQQELKNFAEDIINRADEAKKEEDKQKKEEAFNKINDDVNKKEEEVKESMGDAYNTSANKKAFKDLRGIVNDKEKQGKTKENDLRK